MNDKKLVETICKKVVVPSNFRCARSLLTVLNVTALYRSLAFLLFFFVFYTVPLTLASQLVDPDSVGRLFPEAASLAKDKSVEITLLLSGLTTALIWSGFFALCPIIFQVCCAYGRIRLQYPIVSIVLRQLMR